MRHLAIALTLALAPAVQAAPAEVITGKASVVDADTIVIAGRKIRLHGIDAPEAGQKCRYANGKSYRCGRVATNMLIRQIGKDQVTCTLIERDRYNRSIGRCFVVGRNRNGRWAIDLSAVLVAGGWALAYRKYDESLLALQAWAKRDKAGMFKGTFVPPWEHRKGRRQKHAKQKPAPVLPAVTAAASCPARRYCKQIKSHAEACRLLKQCGMSRLDRDGDNAPCEGQFGKRVCR